MKILVDSNSRYVLLLDPDPSQAVSERMELVEIDDSYRSQFGQHAAYKWDGSKIVIIPQPVVQSEAELASDDLTSSAVAAMARLSDIINYGGGYTGIQVRDGMVDLARILRKLLRLVSVSR